MALIINQQPDDISFAKNPVIFELATDYTVGQGGNAPDNYKARLQIQMEETWGSGTFTTVAELDVFFDSDGLAFANIQGILDSELEESFNDMPIPEFGVNGAYQANNVRKYKIRYAERYGVPPATQGFAETSEKTVMAGGISEQLYAKIDWFASRDATNTWMTWYPDKKRLCPDQPEYLAWYNFQATGLAGRMRVELYNENDLSNPYTTLTKHINDINGDLLVAAAHESLIFPVGFEQLGLDQRMDADDIVKYRVCVEDQTSTKVSPYRTYYLDRDHYETKIYLLYLNGYYLPEVMRLTGKTRLNVEIERYLSDTPGTSAPNPLRGSMYQFDQEFRQIYTYRTGYYKKKEIEALQELVVYNQGFEIYEDGYIPILILGDKFDFGQSHQVLNALEFRAMATLKKKDYSDEYVQPPIQCGPGAWQEDNEECWETPGHIWEVP